MEEKQIDLNISDSIASSFLRFGLRCFNNSNIPVKDDEHCYSYLGCIDDENVLIETYKGTSKMSSNSYSMSSIVDDSNIISIINHFGNQGIAVDNFIVHMLNSSIISASINKGLVFDIEEVNNYYVFNKETAKLELHFEKEYYLNLSEEGKSSIKSNFLFSRKVGGWVSRAKYPNLYRAKDVAKRIGLIDRGNVGEMISFEEQMSIKSEKLLNRSERYEELSNKAKSKAESLQSGFNRNSSDIAFLTQPNINSSSGRSFTRYRERLIKAYEKGFEEFKKSEYYEDLAKSCEANASLTKPTDKAFCLRRIAEAEKDIRGYKKVIDKYNNYLERLNSGEKLTSIKGENLTKETVLGWIEDKEYGFEQALSKLTYYNKCLDDLGGLTYSKESIQKGFVVELRRWGKCKVVGVGPKNISYVILEGGAKGMGGTCNYGDIVKIVSSVVSVENHPFKVGETYSVKKWNGENYIDYKVEIIKVTSERVTLKGDDGKTYTRKPKLSTFGGESWSISIFPDSYNGYFTVKVK